MRKTFLLKTMLLLCALVAGSSAWAGDPVVIYSETFGTTGNKTEVSSYEGFSSSLITPTSTGWKISNTTTSPCNLTGSSGSCNAYCGGTSDIIFNFGNKLSGYTDVKLSFNYNKGAGNGKANTIKLYLSGDGGTNYGSDLIPSNTGATGWYAVTNISIPADKLNNLCIKFSSATNTNRLDDIIITGVSAASTPYTVTLGDDNSTLTEASVGAGVTLPSRTLNSDYDYTFEGWSVTYTDETTTAPTIIPAGTYKPSANITLYPVYKRSETIETVTTYYYTSTPKLPNAITGINASYTLDLADNQNTVNLSVSSATYGTVQYEVVNTEMIDNHYNLTNGVLAVSSNGYIKIRLYVDATETYRGAEKMVEVTVTDDPDIWYAGESESTEYGTPYTVDADLIYGGDITEISSSNTNVATVAGLVITPVAVGTTTITIKTAAGTYYNAGSATFTLNVTPPVGKTTAASSMTEVFNETFSECTSTGGNSDGFTTSSSSEISSANNYTDIDGWSFTKGYPADGCVKFGTGSAKGSATTPSIGTAGTLSLSFRAGAWDKSGEGTTLVLKVSEGSIDNEEETVTSKNFTLTQGAFNTFTATIYDATEGTKITFEAQSASNNRFFLDDVVVSSEGANLSTTLNDDGYATYCSEYPLDFSGATDYSAWQITDIDSDNKITFEKITGSVKGGTGIFLMGTPRAKVTLTSANSTSELDDNLLEGTLAPTYVAANAYYGLFDNTFKKVKAGTVPAGKALLPADYVNEARQLTFIFEDTQGISTIEHSALSTDNAIYSISGQRVSTPKKGLYIVNGKKVVMK